MSRIEYAPSADGFCVGPTGAKAALYEAGEVEAVLCVGNSIARVVDGPLVTNPKVRQNKAMLQSHFHTFCFEPLQNRSKLPACLLSDVLALRTVMLEQSFARYLDFTGLDFRHRNVAGAVHDHDIQFAVTVALRLCARPVNAIEQLIVLTEALRKLLEHVDLDLLARRGHVNICN
nr:MULTISPECIES: hypothetical protein [unclassified Paraburkholderia]